MASADLDLGQIRAQRNNSGSYARFYAVTPSDTVDLPFLPTAIYVGVGGTGKTITFQDVDGNSVLLTGLLSGTIYPIRAARIMSTGTDATNIVAMAPE